MTPTPVGLHEIARRFGRTPGEVARWYATGSLPRPAWTVNNGPAWRWETIERWARERNEPLPVIPRKLRRSA